MDSLFALLYAAHASGSHHKLVLRGMRQMRSAEAEGWARLMLSRSRLLLDGSKEPDKSFRDFQNHVLHPPKGPDDKGFGGAVEAAERWYARLVDMLERHNWDDAIHAAGVLSHYVSDPLMPLHTGSSDAETHVHRGIEWTISRDFESLWEAAPTNEEAGVTPERFSGDNWLAEMLQEGAREAHEVYMPLIDAYDRKRGAKVPEEGLNEAGRMIASRQMARAAGAIAIVFDRAVEDASVAPPKVSLTLRHAIATLGVPFAWVRRKLDDMAEQSAVRRIYDEIEKTGGLEKNLPAECRTVRIALELAKKGRLTASAAAPTRPPREGAAGRRPRLARESDVVDAPSIGPKTAARLAKLGVHTVGDLLGADPKSIADGLNDRRMTAKNVTDWRDQALLLTRLPNLRRAEAVLLVASGYRDVPSIAAADPKKLQDALAQAAQTPRIQRALRNPSAPDAAAIARVIGAARELNVLAM